MYHSNIVVVIWLAVFALAAIAALFKKKMRAFLFIICGTGLLFLGMWLSDVLGETFGAVAMSVSLLASSLLVLLGIMKTFKDETS